jgi:hypothetical protein
MQAAAPLTVTPSQHLPRLLARGALALALATLAILFYYYFNSVFMNVYAQHQQNNLNVNWLWVLVGLSAFVLIGSQVLREQRRTAAVARITLFDNATVLVETRDGPAQEARWLACVRLANYAWCRVKFGPTGGANLPGALRGEITVWFAGSREVSTVVRRWHSLRHLPQPRSLG